MKKFRIFILFICLLLPAVSASSEGSEPVRFVNASESVYVRSGEYSENIMEKTDYIPLCGGEIQSKGVIRFNLDGINKYELTKATLTLYTSQSPSQGTIKISETESSWDSNTVWNTFPLKKSFEALAQSTNLGIEYMYTVDVTKPVLLCNKDNISFCVETDSSSVINIANERDINEGFRPQIKINYKDSASKSLEYTSAFKNINGGSEVSFNLENLKENIVSAVIKTTPLCEEVPAAFDVSDDGGIILSRTVNTSGKLIYIDVTPYVKAGEINTFEFLPQDTEISFTGNVVMKIVTAPVIGIKHRADFEDGSFGDLSGFETAKRENISVVDAPGGGKALSAYLHHTDAVVANSKRSEIHRPEVGGIGSEYWYTFSVYLPDDYVADNMEIITQWHVAPDTNLGEVWRSPPLGMKITGGNFAVSNRWDPKPKTEGNDPSPEGGMNDNIGLGVIERGKWIDWVFHVKWSEKDDGILEIWRDGAKLYTKHGPTTYNDQSLIYMKHGIYKGSYLSETNYGAEYKRILYDNSCIYYHNESLAEILPEKYPVAVSSKLYLGRFGGDSPQIPQLKQGYNTIVVTAQNVSFAPQTVNLKIQLVNKITGEIMNGITVRKNINYDDFDISTAGFIVPADAENYMIRVFAEDDDGNIVSNSENPAEKGTNKFYNFENGIHEELNVPETASTEIVNGNSVLKLPSGASLSVKTDSLEITPKTADYMASADILLDNDNTTCELFRCDTTRGVKFEQGGIISYNGTALVDENGGQIIWENGVTYNVAVVTTLNGIYTPFVKVYINGTQRAFVKNGITKPSSFEVFAGGEGNVYIDNLRITDNDKYMPQ